MLARIDNESNERKEKKRHNITNCNVKQKGSTNNQSECAAVPVTEIKGDKCMLCPLFSDIYDTHTYT